MPFAVMKHWHPMIGRDLHIPWVPGTPMPAPSPVPYISCSTLFGFSVVSSYATSHQTMGWGYTMLRGTDIGFLIPHFGPPSLLTPLDMIFSSSKSYFGPSAYQAEGKPIAAALFVIANPNLNCGTPLPLPVGLVLAINTHFVGMSWADVGHGLLAGVIDFSIQAALSWVSGKIGDWIANRIAPQVMSKQAMKQFLRSQGAEENGINQLARSIVNERTARANAILGHLPDLLRTSPQALTPAMAKGIETVVGFGLGGPMGLDVGTFNPKVSLGGRATEAIQNYFNSPSVETHGTPAPPLQQPVPQIQGPPNDCP